MKIKSVFFGYKMNLERHRKEIFIVAIIFIYSFYACQPAVTFTQAQPEGVNALKKLPTKFTGSFVSADADDTLIVNQDIMVLHLTYENLYFKSDLDSNQQLVGDTLIDLNSNYREKVVVMGDSLISRVYEIDTLFYNKRGDLVKKYKGHYLINEFIEEEKWEVSDLIYMDGNLMISKIDDPREIEMLKTLTLNKNDSTRNFTASKKQFREFLTNGGFGAGDIYYRIVD